MYISFALYLSIFLYVIYLLQKRKQNYIINHTTRLFEDARFSPFLIVLFIYMIFVRTFVDEMSVSDLQNYHRAFDEVSVQSLSNFFTEYYSVRIEVGYRLFMKLSSWFSENFLFFLFVHAVLSQVLLYKLLKNYSSSPLISSILFCVLLFCPSIYILRQYLALLILFNSVEYIIKSDFKKYCLVLLLAISIHNTAIVFAPVYFLVHIKKLCVYLWTLICCMLLIGASFTTLFFYFGETVFGNYDTYLYTDKYIGSNFTEPCIYSCFFIVYLFYARKHIWDNILDRFFLTCSFMGLIISFSGAGLPLVGRLGLYYNAVVILLVPRTMSYIKSKLIRTLFFIVVVSLMILAFFNDPAIDTYKLIF